jgi:hypothetical protein
MQLVVYKLKHYKKTNQKKKHNRKEKEELMSIEFFPWIEIPCNTVGMQ